MYMYKAVGPVPPLLSTALNGQTQCLKLNVNRPEGSVCDVLGYRLPTTVYVVREG